MELTKRESNFLWALLQRELKRDAEKGTLDAAEKVIIKNIMEKL